MGMQTVLEEMQEYAEAHRVPIIAAASRDVFLNTIRERQPMSVLEIGGAIGYSALLMLSVLPAGAHIVSVELDPERARIAKGYLEAVGCSEQATILNGDAADILPGLSGCFDMVFIDAAKGHYLEYLQAVMDKLLPGAVIFADNVLFRGWVESDECPRRFRTIAKRMRQYLDFVQSDPRFCTTLFRIGDGVAVSIYQGAKQHE